MPQQKAEQVTTMTVRKETAVAKARTISSFNHIAHIAKPAK